MSFQEGDLTHVHLSLLLHLLLVLATWAERICSWRTVTSCASSLSIILVARKSLLCSSMGLQIYGFNTHTEGLYNGKMTSENSGQAIALYLS